MSPERWQKIEEIFLRAVEIASDEERLLYLAGACAGDAELRGEVEWLLAQDRESDGFMGEPALAGDALPGLASRLEGEDPLIGRSVGAYRIEREIGRGGMGAVYLAERADGSFDRRVAVKLIRRGMDTDFILRRFRQERQILASLNHPFIAALLDGGTTPDGLSYFVMEYVEGRPLYRYCDEKRLGVRERLGLIRQLCSAVDYAHGNRVVHRDIKPSNVLVTPQGIPKLLDFGIAKVQNPELALETVAPTQPALRMLTPEYASPEQVRGDEATPAADIYSLGVLLYELLTGHRPYCLRDLDPFEMARVVCEAEPESPASCVTSPDNLVVWVEGGEAALEDVYRARGTPAEELRRELSGELERVMLKALRKEPRERYPTAAALADDITRWLEHRPVGAEAFPAPAGGQVVTPSGAGAPAPARPAGAESGPAAAGDKSLAVLPFKMLNPRRDSDTGDEYFGVGLADSLISRLSGIQRFVVRPTSSVLRFDEGVDSYTAGRELGVNFVLEGTVRRAGERIRVTAQLLSVRENSTRWAQSFHERYTDVLELEELISERVAESLVTQLSGEEQRQISKRGTGDVRAYEAYLRGRYFWSQMTPESMLKAHESFRAAIDLDPAYALAHVGLADSFTWANIYGLIPSSEAVPKAEAAALRAVEMDDRLGEAYATLGLVNQNRCRWEEAEKLYQRSVGLNPNYVHAHEWRAATLVGTGRFEEGIEESRLTEHLEPVSLRTKTLSAWTLYQARRFDEALEKGREIIELDRNYPQGYAQVGINLLMLGRAAEGLASLLKFDEMIPRSALAKYMLCHALVAAGRAGEARAVLADIGALAAAEYVKPYFLGMAHAALGERDAAFAYFEESFAEHDPWMLWLGTEPMLEALRGDPRHVELLRRMKNPIAERLRGA
jgi:serine/threonine protein kinase/TolB-like protein